MNMMRLQLKWAARIEFIASGLYTSLARRYSNKEEMAKTLSRFSKDEHKHGLMFRNALSEEFGQSVRIVPWVFCGRTAAFFQYLIPLRWKLKTLSLTESLALVLMKKELKSDIPNRYRLILKKIQPDEICHASFYESLYT